MRNLWRKANKSIVGETLIALAARISVLIALLTTLSYFYIFQQIESSKLDELSAFTQERAERESQIFLLAENNHQHLKKELLQAYSSSKNKPFSDEFNDRFIRQPDGAIRNNPNNFDANTTAGFWMAADVVINPEIKYRAVLFNELISQYGKSWRGQFINTYAMAPENFASNYWPDIPDFVSRISHDFDIRKQEYFSISIEQNNPQRETQWTGVYKDKQSDLWMVSVETPIYLDERHIATVGNDMALDALFKRTLYQAPRGVENIIFGADGGLIADANYIEQLKMTDARFMINRDGDALLKAVYKAVLARNPDQRIVEIKSHDLYLMVSQISGPDWFYVSLVPTSLVNKVASSTAAAVFLFGLITFVIELLILLFVIRRKIALPLVKLNRATLAFGRSRKPKKLKGLGQNELGRLAKSFHAMSVSLHNRDNQLASSSLVLKGQLQQLQNSQKSLAHAQSVAQLGSWEFDVSNNNFTITKEFVKLLNIDEKTFNFRDIKVLYELLNANSSSSLEGALKKFIGHGTKFSCSHQLINPQGVVRFVHSTGQVERNDAGEIILYTGTIQDLTEQYDTQHAIKESEQLFSNVFHNSSFGMAIVNLEGKITQANDNLCKNFGYSQTEILDLFYIALVHPDERHLAEDYIARIIKGEISGYDLERVLIQKNGTEVCCHINVFVQKDAFGLPSYIFIQCMDITLRKKAENKLNQLAFHDPLTNLANRTLFVEFLSKAIKHYRRDPEHNFALLFLDLDGFKLVNDSLGHLEGDKLLVAITQRLLGEIRDCDTLARFGGDEFCILLDEILNEDQVMELAKRINDALAEPFLLKGEFVNTNASIGIVLASDQLNEAEEYLRDADSAMYHAKHQGRGRFAVFNSDMHLLAKRQLRLRNELSTAITEKQFVAFYQPIVDTVSGKISGFESLVRWQHPDRGLLEPIEFLGIAEDMRIISEIDFFVFDAAMAQLVKWRAEFSRNDLYVSCNSSSETISTYRIVETIGSLLLKHDLPPSCLNIEVTENVLIKDPEITLSILLKLHELGIKIHLDDFGTGYSSLSYLHRFPIQNIKIDRSFIDGIMAGKKDHAIVESIVLLASRLGISVTAEGVETTEQYEKLEEIGASRTQGFYHGKPVDAVTIGVLLEDDLLKTLIDRKDSN